MKIINRE